MPIWAYLQHFVRRFAPLPVGDDFHDGLGRLAKLPEEVRAVLLGQPIAGNLDVQAQEGVRHQGWLADGVKQADVGRR